MFRKGSVLIWSQLEEDPIAPPQDPSTQGPSSAAPPGEGSSVIGQGDRGEQDERQTKCKIKKNVVILHEDIIGDQFWEKYSYILA